MHELTFQEKMMAAELAERHRIPQALCAHPKGVIVQGDEFMTDKLRDPDYVPYCMSCEPAQRMRRVIDGFECPTCRTKANWDLTTFNHNVNVEFDVNLADPVFIAAHKENVRLISEHEALHKETYTAFKAKQNAQARLDWQDDQGKKNTSYHKCGKCTHVFFGKNKRKYCRKCQTDINVTIAYHHQQNQPHPYIEALPAVNRKERRHG